jgi:HNH endonuclease
MNEIGATCNLYKTCNICEQSKHYLSFGKKSGKTGINSKKNRRNSYCLECREEHLLRRNLKRVRNKILKGEDIETTPSYEAIDFSQPLYLYDKSGGFRDQLSEELLKRYFDEGTCESYKEFPNIIYFKYPTKYDKLRGIILERDDYKCYFCGEYGGTVEHLQPVSRGGLNTPKNCVCACLECNNEKGDMTLSEYEKFKNGKMKPQYNKNGIMIQ